MGVVRKVNELDPKNTSREAMLEVMLTTLLSDPRIVKIVDNHDPNFSKYARILIEERPRMCHSNYRLLTVDEMVKWALVHGGPGFRQQMEKHPDTVRAGLCSGGILMLAHVYAEFAGAANPVLSPDNNEEIDLPEWMRMQLVALTRR